MIYPKNIVDYVASKPELKERFPDIATITEVSSFPMSVTDGECEFEEYMLTEGYKESRAIRKYLLYLSLMYDTFNNIFQYFPKENVTSTHKDDVSAIGTAPFELFYHALYLYCLDSWGVEGDVIECGTYKGFSACCLSWVCKYLKKKLIVADSFEGLPENTTDPYYKKGDFCGNFDEVHANIEDFGALESVEFIKGFYDVSLQGFRHTLCMLWMDVDLFESSTDILKNVFASLSKNGVIISHELFAERDFANGLLKPTIGPSKALHEFFEKTDIRYFATPLENGSGLVIPALEKNAVQISLLNVQYLRDRCRQSDHLIAKEQVKYGKDISHWQQEQEKLMQLYKSTIDFKIKKIIKSLLVRLGIRKLD